MSVIKHWQNTSPFLLQYCLLSTLGHGTLWDRGLTPKSKGRMSSDSEAIGVPTPKVSHATPHSSCKWVFTVNNPTKVDYQAVKSLEALRVHFLIAGNEAVKYHSLKATCTWRRKTDWQHWKSVAKLTWKLPVGPMKTTSSPAAKNMTCFATWGSLWAEGTRAASQELLPPWRPELKSEITGEFPEAYIKWGRQRSETPDWPAIVQF